VKSVHPIFNRANERAVQEMIAVFLNNKLLSCDTIVPLMQLVKARYPERDISYYCFDRSTCVAIRRNIVLWDAIQATGNFKCLAPAENVIGRVVRYIRLVFLMAFLTVTSILGRVHFIHFKALNTGKLRWLARVNNSRTILFEANCWGYEGPVLDDIDNIKRQRKRPTKAGCGITIVGFNADWPEMRLEENASKKKLILPSTHLNATWLEFVRERSDFYLKGLQTGSEAITDQPVIVFILGYLGKFDFLKYDNSMLALLEETLEVLAKTPAEIPVILKPHIITDREIIERYVSNLPAGKFIISDLHPAVLASRAMCFIGNYYSTTFADATAFQVPTIEYTEYSDRALGVTNGGSMRPVFVSEFINKDPEKLRTVLCAIASNPTLPVLPDASKNESFDTFLDHLAT
jgi:hypothetical protein